MTFGINRIELDGLDVSFPSGNSRGNNKISLLIGPNGVGKTRVLAELAVKYRGGRSVGSKTAEVPLIHLDSQSIPDPRRVVAQTFSPFSRFPSERRKVLRLSEYLKSDVDSYAVVGFSRGTGLRGSVSKDAVGRIVRKLYTRPDHAASLGAALRALGFSERVELWFRQSPAGPNVNFDINSDADLRANVKTFLAAVESRGSVSSSQNRLARELDDAQLDREKLIIDIAASISEIRNISMRNDDSLSGQFDTFKLNISLDIETVIGLKRILKSLITLDRVGILRLVDCNIFPNGSRKEWGRFTSKRGEYGVIDLTEASSGEQQLLSSLFGLVAEAEDDSLILIDEPELSLHPLWQTQFLDLLIDSLQGFSGCHLIIASHSALVAQRAAELGIAVTTLSASKTDNIFGVRSTPSVESTLLQTFGFPVRSSEYVAHGLIKLLAAAKRLPDQRMHIQRELDSLASLYEGASVRDGPMLSLIADAKRLLASDQNVDD